MYLKNYKQFNESLQWDLRIKTLDHIIEPGVDVKKINMISNLDLSVGHNFFNKEDSTHTKLSRFISSSLFNIINKFNINDGFNTNLPTIDMIDSGNFTMEKIYNNEKIDKSNFYNYQYGNKQLCLNKKKFHIELNDKNFIPKTIYNIEDVLTELEFPIVAKKAKGSSGIGIMKYNTKQDFKKHKEELGHFDIFSQWIPIDKEYRLIFFKKDLLLFARRKNRSEKAKFFINNDNTERTENVTIDSRMDFIYKFDLVENFYNLAHFKKIKMVCDEVIDTLQVDYICIDIVIDNNGNIMVIECNTSPFDTIDLMPKLYESIWNYHYNMDMDPQTKIYLKYLAKEMIIESLKGPSIRVTKELKNYYQIL